MTREMIMRDKAFRVELMGCRSWAAKTLSGHELGHALAPVDWTSGTGSSTQLFSSWLNTVSDLYAEIMATELDLSDSSHPVRLTSEPLEAVRHLRVDSNNLETSTNDGLDFERCSALHNAIVKHAWQAEGYHLADLPTATWWQRPDYAPRLDELQEYLPESLVEFLKRALSLAAEELPDSSRYYFFYLSDCLSHPDSLWYEVGEPEGEMGGIERVALYLTDTDTSNETLDGIL